jgi:uncharacterized protein involved in exopolysaccharide biosynthesis
MLRLLETFFRRWYLYLVPVVILAVVGVMSVSGTKSKFQSVGTINVADSTVLSNLNGNNTQSNPFGDSPATTTAKQINSTLQTDQFVKDIATRAGLDNALNTGKITPKWIRSSLGASANGQNLVSIVATNEDPQIAQHLAQATIDAYVQSVIDAASSQSKAAVTFFDNLVTTYQGDITNAQKALDAFVSAHPAPALGQRPEDEQAQINALNSTLTQAQTNYNTALGKRQDAQLSTEQTKADVGQRLKLVDAPLTPLAPQGKTKKMIASFGTFLALGILLSVGAVVLATVLNHTLLTAADVKERLGVRVLAVVPAGGAGALKPMKIAKVKAPKAPKEAKADKDGGRTGAQKPKQARPAPVKPIPASSGRRKPAAGTPAPTPAPARVRAGQARTIGRASGTSGWPG